MKLLLHVCCAPCLIYPLEALRLESFDITLFFFNPNIDSKEEHERRLSQVEEYAAGNKLALEVISYDPTIFEDKVRAGLKERCKLCYDIRLGEAARLASEESFDAFTTTLLVSPHQDQGAIKEIGQNLASKEGASFLFRDFRQGFRNAQNRARELGLHIQNYCGCTYSKEESRIRRSKK